MTPSADTGESGPNDVGKPRTRAGSAVRGVVATALLGQAVVAASGILAARILGVEDRGILALLVTVALPCTLLGSLGGPTAIGYYVSSGIGDPAAMWQMGKRLLARQVVAVAAVQAVALIVLFHDQRSEAQIAAVLSIVIPSATMAQLYAMSMLQGLLEFRAFNLVRVAPPVSYAAVLVPLFVIGGGDLLLVTILWVITVVVVAIASFRVAAGRVMRASPSPHARAVSQREVLAFGGKGLLGTANPSDGLQLDQVVIGAFLSPVQLGFYVSAVAFTNLARFIGQSIGMVAFPAIASRPASEHRRLVLQYVGLGALACGSVTLALELSVDTLLPLLFGEEFRPGLRFVHVLLLAGLLAGVRRTVAEAARGRGRAGAGSVAEVISWISLLIALPILVPTSGALGVAWSMVIASAVSVVVLLYLALRPTTALGHDHGPPGEVAAGGESGATLTLQPRPPAT